MNNRILLEIIQQNAASMFREANGLLKYPFLDPAGQYGQTLWDWDSYWTSMGLLEAGKQLEKEDDGAFYRRAKQYAAGSLLNFFTVQGNDGSLPILMSADDPDWFDCLTDAKANIAKPVQGQYLKLLNEHQALPQDEIRRLLPQLRRVTECRLARFHHADTRLLLWADEAAIGVDDDPCVWGRPDFSCAQVFLNSLWNMDLQQSMLLAGQLNDREHEQFFHQLHQESTEAIQQFLWDKRDGFYYSADVQVRQKLKPHRHFHELNANLQPFWQILPLRICTWGGFMPLWCAIATREQAEQVVQKLADPKLFWSDYGVRSLSKNEERFYRPLQQRGNPSNWLGPIWVIVNYIAHEGLKKYGYHDLAGSLRQNLVSLLIHDYRNCGFLHEYYDPESGIGVYGEHFLSWNLLALCMKED